MDDEQEDHLKRMAPWLPDDADPSNPLPAPFPLFKEIEPDLPDSPASEAALAPSTKDDIIHLPPSPSDQTSHSYSDSEVLRYEARPVLPFIQHISLFSESASTRSDSGPPDAIPILEIPAWDPPKLVFPCEEKEIDPVVLPVFPGLCLCEPTRGGFSYTIIGSAGSAYFDATAEGLPRDGLCVCGERIQVTFLSNQNSGNRQYHFLVIPRGIEALVATGWRPEIESRELPMSDERAADPDLLSRVGFDWGSRLRFVGDFAFRECSTLSSFFIPASVEQIGHRAFEKCGNLVAVTIANGSRLKPIGGSAFYDCAGLQSIDLPPNLEYLSADLLYNCSNLCFLPLGSLQRLSTICDSACQHNRSLRSVVIPGSVVEIGAWAFDDCVSLVEVDFVLPSKLASIGTESFRGCESLRQFLIVESVTEIGGSFLQGSGVDEVSVDSGNSKFKAIDGLIVSGDGKSIVCYFGADEDVRIDAKIEIVGNNSFEGCEFLRSVTFESGSKLKVIEHCAFQNCKSLELVQFGGPCPTLGPYSFDQCKKLKEVLLESTSDRLLDWNDPHHIGVFNGCSSLKRK